jgi:signal peptidase II
MSRSNISRFAPFVLSAAIIIFDRITKIAIRDNMDNFSAVNIVTGWLRIIHTENPGAAFGVLADGNPVLRPIILIGVSALVLMFVVSALLGRSPSFAPPLIRFGLGLVLGGAAGNLYDRVTRGTVTDFIEVFHGNWSFPAFNVADSAITMGAALLLLDLLRTRNKPVGQEPAGSL